MYFLVGLMIVTMLVMGANFCILLSGGIPFRRGTEFGPIGIGGKSYSVERFVMGMSTSVFGLSWFAAWGYFLLVGWSSFASNWSFLIWHVALQLLAAAGLLAAGIGIFKKWKRSTGLFLASMGLLLFSVGVAIVIYGPRGHGEPVFMYLFGIWTLIVGGVFTTAVLIFDKLANELGEGRSFSSKLPWVGHG
jgi:hypothetical protein